MLEGMEINWKGREEFEVVSNVTARSFGGKEEVRELVSRQCTETVRWAESIRWLDRERGVERWVGVGPGRVGRNLVGKEVRGGMDRVVGVEGGDGKSFEDAIRQLEEMPDLEESEQR